MSSSHFDVETARRQAPAPASATARFPEGAANAAPGLLGHALSYARSLTSASRTLASNRGLGFSLAFVAGATNGAAYLAVRQFTSHMSGFVTSMGDGLALSSFHPAAAAGAALLSFALGALCTTMLVGWARRRGLQSAFALPLLLEAALLLALGLAGARLGESSLLWMPAAAWLLCFAMGLQNAVASCISSGEIRTTHMTGNLTDIAIELGKVWCARLPQRDGMPKAVANGPRLATLCGLLGCFFGGAVSGALGFTHGGYMAAVPLAAVLALLAVVPSMDDIAGAASPVLRARIARVKAAVGARWVASGLASIASHRGKASWRARRNVPTGHLPGADDVVTVVDGVVSTISRASLQAASRRALAGEHGREFSVVALSRSEMLASLDE